MSEWGIERLDVPRYMERIGHAGALAPTLQTLTELHRAHVTSIVFENVDVLLGRPIGLELDAVQDKLVTRRRGGYCFEQGLLFAAALERGGFSLTRLIARVNPGAPGPRTHMLSVVVIDDAPWLADVGFGAGLLGPIALQPGTEVEQEGWCYRLDRDGEKTWRLASRQGEAWSDMYTFTLEAQLPIDYVVANHYPQSHPRSPFVGGPLIFANHGAFRHRLRGLELATEHPGGSRDPRVVEVSEIADVLAGTFGIVLDAAQASALRARLG